MTSLILLLPIFLSILSRTCAEAPPILSTSLTSQLVPSNPAISSAFLIPPTSALLTNASSPFPALRVPPSWSFSLGFSGATFLPSPGSSQKLVFSSELDNGDPLPDWIVFSRETITFGGVTPKNSHGIQVLKIVVTATANSDMTTSDTFTLIVSPHDLSVTSPLLARNVTANNTFSIVLDDWKGIQVDGESPNSSALTPTVSGEIEPEWTFSGDSANLSLTLDLSSFPWLKYDVSSCTLSGSPPQSVLGAPLPIIPASVKLAFAQTGQFLSVPTNLTLVIVPSIFSSSSIPVLSAPPGTKLAFALAPFLTNSGSLVSNSHRRAELGQNPSSNVNVSATWAPQNATWLSFDNRKLLLSGTVPQDAPEQIQVVFTAQDETTGTVSRTQMRIDMAQGGGDGEAHGILPTDTLRSTGKKIKLAIGIVFGVAAAVILLACLLAICRHCCVAREHVQDVYVIDQSAYDGAAPYKSSLEKQGLRSSEVSAVASDYLGLSLASAPPLSPRVGHTMTKAAFFDAVRTRFGSDGSWRRNPNGARSTSGGGSGLTNGSDHTGISFFGAGKRPRKSKISKPMVMLSSSTSIRDGFAERRLDGAGSHAQGTGSGPTTNFTIFGDGNIAGTGDDDERHGITPTGIIRNSPDDSGGKSIGRMFMSSPGAILAYDRSRSNSDPVRSSVHGSVLGSPSKRQSASASAPSLGTGTQSGTQSTFATGESTRLTNAAGEVPFRRPGFDGRWETLAERSMREAGRALAERSTGNIGAERSISRPLADRPPRLFLPPRALVKGMGNLTPISLPRMAVATSNNAPDSNSTPSKSALSTPSTPPAIATSNNSFKSSSIPNSVQSKDSSHRGNPNPKASGSAQPSAPPQIGTPTRSNSGAKSDRSAGASYRPVFFGDKGNESEGSTEDVGKAVITHVVNSSSTVSPVMMGAAQGTLKPGKPRLVAFTHERTTAAHGQGPRRDISQKAVLQGAEDSDPEAEMRIGLEYVRQLGDPDTNYPATKTMPSTTGSFASNPSRTPSAEFYASNHSNNSIAGRSRVLAPLVIRSHRGRHAAQSMGSTHDSYLSLELPRESRWLFESSLPRFTFSTKEPFNFAVPLDREHKYALALAGSALEAKQADGRPLPGWLRFDKGGKEFWGVTPNTAHSENGEMHVTRVVVKIWDGEKDEVVGGCIIEVSGEKE